MITSRNYDYRLGGKDNFAADRAAGDKVIELRPEIVHGVKLNRRFLGRAVRYLAAEAGVRQFLDVGTGLPSADNTHEVAQAVAPSSRIVYVDNDPIVLAHARALLTSAPEGKTTYVSADLRDSDAVLTESAKTLDLAQPVALMFLMTLQYVPDEDDPHGLVSRYLDALAPGSFLVISDTISEGNDQVLAESVRRMNEGMGGRTTQTRRTPAALAEFLAGLELVDPGLAVLNQWRPAADDPPLARDIPALAAIGRKLLPETASRFRQPPWTGRRPSGYDKQSSHGGHQIGGAAWRWRDCAHGGWHGQRGCSRRIGRASLALGRTARLRRADHGGDLGNARGEGGRVRL